MIKRFLPLVLMLAWAPAALAFPPCKPGNSPLQLLPLGDVQPTAPGDTAAWFRAGYVMAGNQTIIDELKASTNPSTGKCRDLMPIPGTNASTGVIGLNPGLSPINGYGIISLPELPTISTNGLNLQYTLDFTIDNAPLLNTGDWMDVGQLDFAQDRGLTTAGWPVSSVYRVRKIQRRTGTMIQVIEARGSTNTTKPAPIVSVVAELPLTGENGKTAIALRWTQYAQAPVGELEAPTAPLYAINSTMEILGMGKQTTGTANVVMYSVALPRQWADALSMGLLDYNAPGGQPYSSGFRVVIDNTSMDAKTL
jgi:hypothetical protein